VHPVAMGPSTLGVRAAGVLADPLTARGTSWGSRVVVTGREPCAVFLGARLDLLWTSQTHGFEPTHVHLRDPTTVGLVRLLVPHADITCELGCDWVAGLPAVAFVQGRASVFPCLLAECEFILATQARPRDLQAASLDWHVTNVHATHASVGSVTDSAERCYLWARSLDHTAVYGTVHLPTVPLRDVHSVVSDVVAGKASKSGRPLRMLQPVVTEIRSGLFHAGGLYPCKGARPSFRV
jgi:hypothetical protein